MDQVTDEEIQAVIERQCREHKRIALARVLSREQAAEVANVSADALRQWVSDGTIAREYLTRDEGRGGAYQFTPEIVALLMIAGKVAEQFGPKSKLLKPIVQAIGRDVLDAWNDPRPRRLRIDLDGLTIMLDVTRVIAEARERVAALE